MPLATRDGKRKVAVVDETDPDLFTETIFRFSGDTAATQHRHDTLVKAERHYLRSAGMVCLLVNQTGKPMMKKLLLSIAVAAAAPFAWAQVSETTTTTTTTENGGTITEYTPGSAIVLKESSGPRRYRFGKTVTYVTKSGKTLDEDTVRTRIKVGVPVHVHYVGTGDDMMVDRVVLDED